MASAQYSDREKTRRADALGWEVGDTFLVGRASSILHPASNAKITASDVEVDSVKRL